MSSVGGESTALSRDLADFLIELSIALHKNAIYPPGHPLLEAAVAGVERRLVALLQERTTLALGVARHQLVIEGVATDGKHPLLRELAARLHSHHLGAVRFQQGLTRAHIADFLATVAEDAGRSGRPLGLEPPDALDRWTHVRLYPLTYDQLQLLEEQDTPEAAEEGGGWNSTAGTARGAQLWIGLARAALATEASAEAPPEANDPTVVARAIEEHGRDQAYDQVVVGYLLQIAQEIKSKRGQEASALQRRISRLVSELNPETLRRLLEMGGDIRQRRRFVLDASQGMAVDAVVDLVQAAAETSQQTVSHSMLRLLTKFAAHAEDGAAPVRHEFDNALRDQVGTLMQEWQLADPNPDEYRRALEGMSRAAPAFDTAVRAFPCESERMLQMALEVGAVGDALWRAVDDLVGRGRFVQLFDLLARAPETHAVQAAIHRVATADRVRELTQQDTLPMPVLEQLCRWVGIAAAEPLLDALEAERHVRAVSELLPTLGEDAATLAIRRLEGARWTTMRQLLVALQRFERLPDTWSPMPLLATHPDADVRREALRLLLKDAARRAAAIELGLTDPDERVVRAALSASHGATPPSAVATLMRKADDATGWPVELRTAAVRVLGALGGDEVRDWLVSLVTTRAGLLRRVRLAPKTPERLAALQLLATTWCDDAVAEPVLALARRAPDAEVRAAAVARPRAARATTPFGLPAVDVAVDAADVPSLPSSDDGAMRVPR